MKLKYFLLISILCLLGGTLFFMIKHNWLIVQLGVTPITSLTLSPEVKQVHHKTVKLFYNKGEKWLSEDFSIMWDEQNSVQNLKLLVKQWLALMQDEHLLPPQITLESVAASPLGNEAYLSFDHSLFSKEWSIIKKKLILESLFKSVHRAGVKINSIMLLVHHRPMEDDHLELSQPLPIQSN